MRKQYSTNREDDYAHIEIAMWMLHLVNEVVTGSLSKIEVGT